MPSLNGDIGELWLGLHPEANAARALRRDRGGAVAKERVVDGLAGGRIAPGRTAHALDRLLHAYDSVSEARASIGRYLDFYNSRRPHSSLDGIMPDQTYFTPLSIRLAA